MKELLSIQRLSVSFEENNFAVRDISFSLQDGEFVVLLGSSGAGKSTLLRSLNGLVRPCSGSIRSRHHGEISASTNRQLRAHRRDTAMVFQQHQLIDRLSVLDNVLMGRLGYHSFLRSLLPLPQSDRTVLTPHIGSAVQSIREDIAMTAARNLKALVESTLTPIR